MYEEEILAYQDDAEDRYDDYDEFDSGFEGHSDSYVEEYEDDYVDEEYDDDYYDYKTTSIGKIDPNDRTYTVVVNNDSQNDGEAIIFGANEEAAQPSGVTVIVEESSHKEVREESKANPFKIVGLKMSVSEQLQFDNILRVTRKTAAGSQTVRVYQPRNATSPQNFSDTLIDDSQFEMDVTGQDSLRFLIKAGVTTVFTFTIKARANMGNLLKGNNVAELSRSPRTTGLPQIDLLRQRKPTAFGLKPRPKPRVRRVVTRRPPKVRRRYDNRPPPGRPYRGRM